MYNPAYAKVYPYSYILPLIVPAPKPIQAQSSGYHHSSAICQLPTPTRPHLPFANCHLPFEKPPLSRVYNFIKLK